MVLHVMNHVPACKMHIYKQPFIMCVCLKAWGWAVEEAPEEQSTLLAAYCSACHYKTVPAMYADEW